MDDVLRQLRPVTPRFVKQIRSFLANYNDEMTAICGHNLRYYKVMVAQVWEVVAGASNGVLVRKISLIAFVKLFLFLACQRL